MRTAIFDTLSPPNFPLPLPPCKEEITIPPSPDMQRRHALQHSGPTRALPRSLEFSPGSETAPLRKRPLPV